MIIVEDTMPCLRRFSSVAHTSLLYHCNQIPGCLQHIYLHRQQIFTSSFKRRPKTALELSARAKSISYYPVAVTNRQVWNVVCRFVTNCKPDKIAVVLVPIDKVNGQLDTWPVLGDSTAALFHSQKRHHCSGPPTSKYTYDNIETENCAEDRLRS